MAVEALVKTVITKLKDLTIEEGLTEWRIQRGIGNDIKFICDEFSTMKAVLRDAETRRVRDEVVNQWVAQVRDEAYKIEDVLEEFQFMMESSFIESGELTGCLDIKYCIRYVHTFFKQMGTRHQFHSQIEIIRKEVDDISTRRLRYGLRKEGTGPSLEDDEETTGEDHGVSIPFVEEDDIVGIDKDVTKLQEWLLKREEAHRRSIISVVGMGGSGKTTIVKKVYKNILGEKFQCNAWVYVSQDFQVKDMLKQMLQGFYESRQDAIPVNVEVMAPNKLLETIYKYLEGKRYVLVLDDIWDVNAWEGVKYALPCKSGGRVIFTTRNMHVASPAGETCYVHQVKQLSNESAWSLFCKKAFKNESLVGYCPKHLEKIGKEMVKRCGGLPLAIVVIGGLMSKRDTNELEWNDVLGNLDWELRNNQDLERLSRVLLTSYNYLPSRLKYCFLYCGMFPEDYRIKTSRLIRLWVAEGFVEDHPRKTLEEVAHGYIIQLIDRNMLQADNKFYNTGLVACRIHDLLRDVAVNVIMKEEFGEIFIKQSNNTIEGQRRVSIQRTSVSIPSNTVNIKTRSFLTFSADQFFPLPSLEMVSCLKSLRVLDMTGSNIEILPSSVVQLIHLRYLSVRGTRIGEIPSSLCKLYNLQTLDVRATKVKSLQMFPQLRHLLLTGSQNVHVTLSPFERTNYISNNLQTLGRVTTNDDLVSQLCYLTQLRKLYIRKVRGEHCINLCAAIEKMQHLRSLSIINTKTILDLETNMSTPPLHLEKLRLYGITKEGHLPQWTRSLTCLRKCVLKFNRLREDPFSTLARLPNLEVLQVFRKAYMGRQIGWGGSSSNEELLNFPKLKALSINHCLELEELSEIEEGMMPCLQTLLLHDCPKLKKLPHGFQYLKSLCDFKIRHMPEDFIKRLRHHHQYHEGEMVEEGEGEDYWMIQHIPTVSNRYSSDGEFCSREFINRK